MVLGGIMDGNPGGLVGKSRRTLRSNPSDQAHVSRLQRASGLNSMGIGCGLPRFARLASRAAADSGGAEEGVAAACAGPFGGLGAGPAELHVGVRTCTGRAQGRTKKALSRTQRYGLGL